MNKCTLCGSQSDDVTIIADVITPGVNRNIECIVNKEIERLSGRKIPLFAYLCGECKKGYWYLDALKDH